MHPQAQRQKFFLSRVRSATMPEMYSVVRMILNGKPAPDTMVEVEYYNVDHRVKAPDDIFITQQVKTDKNGIFS